MRFIPHTWGALGSMIGNAANTDIPWAVVWATNVPLMILMIFCMIMGAVLGSFFCVHVMQVLRNQTSYEGWTYVAKLPAADAEEEGKEATGEEGGAAEGASDGAESCTPPPAPTGKAKRSAAADESVEAEAASDGGRTRGEGAEKKEKDEKKEEEDDDDDEPDRGSTCRIKRQTPAELDAGSSLPPGEWVATHDTGSKWTNLLEVIFPPLTYGFPAGPTHEKDD